MLQISLPDSRTAFSPGEEIIGTARWQRPGPPRGLAVSLGWFTRGKGTEDHETVTTTAIDAPLAQGEFAFRFTAPASPHSFSGKLVSLIWAIELADDSADQPTRVELVIAPDAREIELPRIQPDSLPLPEQARSGLQKFFARTPPQP